jgi:serine/threonine protein kinase
MKTDVGASCPSCQAPLPGAARQCPRCGHSLDSKPKDHLGAVVGNLKLTNRLGEGGMGTVYLAEHLTLGTSYAIKVLHREFTEDSVLAERFRREAIVCSNLRHPNIVFVTDFGLHDQLGLYIAMEHLRGLTLTDRLRQGPLPLWEAFHIAEQVTEGLAAAHEQDIIHRDLKPENIFLVTRPSGRHLAKILDFGIVRIADGKSQNLTQAGMALGTPTYMAPEQVKGSKDLKPSSDLYSMGVMLYEMFSGAPPFQSDQFFELAIMHVNQLPTPLGQKNTALADTLTERLIMELLHKEPAQRPQSAAQLRDRLRAALTELQQRGVPSSLPDDTPSADPLHGEHPNRPTRQTGVLRQIKQDAPDSPIGQLLLKLPNVAALSPELCFVTIWGVALRGLIDNDPAEPAFQATANHLARFSGALLGSAEDLNEPALQALLERSLRELFTLTDRKRQEALLQALRPHLTHPLFPLGALPDWAATGIAGDWTIRSVLTTDVRDLFRRRATTATLAAIPQEPEPPTQPQPEPDSLMDKLRGDVSLKSIKSVFTHDLLNRRKK